MTETLLTIAVALFGGLNIFQFIFLRATMSEHLKEIDGKCNEIAQLKSKLSYFKGLRCYRSACANRMWENSDKNNELKSE